MAQVLGFEVPLNKDDLPIFDGTKLSAINKKVLLKQVYEQQKEIESLKQEIQKIKNDVNSALAQYHKALQVLLKGE